MAEFAEFFDPTIKVLDIDDDALSEISASLSPPSVNSDGLSDSTPDSTLQTPPKQPKPAAEARKKKVAPKRTVFTRRQLANLEARFCQQSFLSREERKEFAADLGITERQVMIWFQNRRGRLKKRGPTDHAYNPVKLDELNARRPYPLLYGMISSMSYQPPGMCQQIMSMYPESVQQTAQSALGPTRHRARPAACPQQPWQPGPGHGAQQHPVATTESATIARLLAYQQKTLEPPAQSQVYQRFSSDPSRLQRCLSVTQNSGATNIASEPSSNMNITVPRQDNSKSEASAAANGEVKWNSSPPPPVTNNSQFDQTQVNQQPEDILALSSLQQDTSTAYSNTNVYCNPSNVTQQAGYQHYTSGVGNQQAAYYHGSYNQNYQQSWPQQSAQQSHKAHPQPAPAAGDTNNNAASSSNYSHYNGGGYDYSHLMSATQGGYGAGQEGNYQPAAQYNCSYGSHYPAAQANMNNFNYGSYGQTTGGQA